jgi:hypothetical protein
MRTHLEITWPPKMHVLAPSLVFRVERTDLQSALVPRSIRGRSLDRAGFRRAGDLHSMGESMANPGKPSKTFLARIHSIDVIFAATLVTHSPCFDCRSGGT